MNKTSGIILTGIILFSFVRLVLIFQNKIGHIYIDFICIILLGFIILYIEKPFKQTSNKLKEGEKL